MDKKFPITQEGFHKLEKELKELDSKRRPKAVELLKSAREKGDLSENSEYHAAKEKLGFIDAQINQLKMQIKSAMIVAKTKGQNSISLGDTVTIQSKQGSMTYKIVGEIEADIAKQKLSISSPIGSSLLGKKKGDVITVSAPSGQTQYTVKSIK